MKCFSSYRIAVILLLILNGCGPSRPATVPVEGTVKRSDGSPIPNASVTFVPQADGRPAIGTTDASGRFELSTFDPGDGALMGTHNVGVACVRITATPPTTDAEGNNLQPPDSKHTVEWLTPHKYADAATSGLIVDVQAGMEPVELVLD